MRPPQLSLADLFAGRFDAYFTAARAGRPLWLFVHVPKTAGSSLNAELAPILPPSAHIFIDYSKLNSAELQQSYEELFDHSVDRFIEAARTKRFRFCTGHINAAQVQRIADAVPRTRPVTLLREPVSRFISDYRYQRSAMHPGHEAFAAAYPSIEDYLRLEGDWNKTTRTLVPAAIRERGDMDACAAWLVDHYAFVGIQEMYELSLHVLSWFAGKPCRPTVRKRINTPTPDNNVELTPELDAEIRARNMMDVALYEAIAPRFAGVAGALGDYLQCVAPTK
jgi:hypothetical protein